MAIESSLFDEFDKRLEQLNEALVRLREATREANSTTKELNRVIREAKHILEHAPKEMVDDKISEALSAGLAELGDEIKKTMSASVDKVGAEFEKLAAIYMEGDDENDKMNIHDLAMKRKWGNRGG